MKLKKTKNKVIAAVASAVCFAAMLTLRAMLRERSQALGTQPDRR